MLAAFMYSHNCVAATVQTTRIVIEFFGRRAVTTIHSE